MKPTGIFFASGLKSYGRPLVITTPFVLNAAYFIRPGLKTILNKYKFFINFFIEKKYGLQI